MESDTPKKGIVLIVDDNLTNLDLLFRYMNRAGFKVLVAQDGQTAIERAKSAHPDVILLDVMMPELDGFETCEQLKADEDTQEIPVIFMTALSDVNSKVKGFRVGGVDYVTKPLEHKEVIARVTTHATIRSLQNNLRAEISERKRAEEKLREYTEQLRYRNEELDAFAHTVAHNLKNPLGALTGIANILGETELVEMPQGDLKHYLDAIVRSGQKANEIVEALLLLSSVRSAEVKVGSLDMATIVTEVTQRLEDVIIEKKVDVIKPKEWPNVVGYRPWVEEVWINYLTNAIKYGGEPPVVEFGAAHASDSHAIFWLQDNGPGLTAEERTKLFIPFIRLNKNQAQGHGLGLSIVRRIVEKLGGEVGISQASNQQGSRFTFTLPLNNQQQFQI